MLVLGRLKGERVIVDGGRLVIEVVEVRGDRVRLGFIADQDVVIDREEVAAAKAREARDGDGRGRDRR